MNANYFEKVNEKYFGKKCLMNDSEYVFQCYYIDEGEATVMLLNDNDEMLHLIAARCNLQFYEV